MKLIIFDLDGVIVSTDTYHYKAWKALADMYGFDFDEKLNHKLRGVSRAESLKIILKENHREVSGVIFGNMLQQKNELYRNSLESLSQVDILPGVEALIEDLKKHNIKVAIGSSSKNTPVILKHIGLDNAFDAIVDGNDISKSKPDPEVFLKCAEAMKVKASECLVYEDAKAGVEAAVSAGMKVIGVGEQPFDKADLVVSDLVDQSYEALIKLFMEV